MSDEKCVNSGSQLAVHRILSVNEEELQQLILNLHDGPVQQLFAAQAQLAALEASAKGGEPVANHQYEMVFTRVSRLIESALAEIRHFLGTFRPPDFAQRDLTGILQALLMHYEMTTGCEVTLIQPKTRFSISLPAKIALYRICQEALANAYKSAQCCHQTVVLSVANGELTMVIADDGVGFNPPPLHGPAATEREEHIGLRGMRDRANLIGAKFALDSAPGQGTKITVKVRIDAESH